jgi:hypothetical protein
MSKRPYPPKESRVKMGRPPLLEGNRLNYIMSVKFREEEIEYLKKYQSAINREQHKLTRVMRDLLMKAVHVFADFEVVKQCELTCARGDRHVFRITYDMNSRLEEMSKAFTQKIDRRVYKIDVAARLIMMLAKKRMDEMVRDGKIEAVEDPLGVSDQRTYNTKDESTEAEITPGASPTETLNSLVP